MAERKKYWYYTVYSICPVCGAENWPQRERRYTPKPKNWDDRNEVRTAYDGCMNHELYGVK